MLQLKNESPFKASLGLFPDVNGVDTLYVAIRATFVTKRGAARIADEQEPVRLADEYAGEPGQSSLKRAADLHLGKPGTDVVLLGEAVAPGGRAAPEVDVSVEVGPVRKVVRVFGDRTWRGPWDVRISPPVPFERMPLVYELAFGGVQSYNADTDEMTRDPRNPVGVGFGLRSAPEDKLTRRLPNLEDPAHLIKSTRHKPPPACFGPIAPSWQPRVGYAGTYDAAWEEKRAPYLPEDFDSRFFHVAAPGLLCEEPLQGGEPCRVVNASLFPVELRLPVCAFDVRVHIDAEVERPAMRLQTVELEPGVNKLGMVWLGSVGCDKRPLRVREVGVALQRLDVGGSR